MYIIYAINIITEFNVKFNKILLDLNRKEEML